MAKNAPNELEFLPDMYFYKFYQIPEDFWKNFKIGRFLARKPPFSAYFASRFRNFFFDGNRIQKCSDLAENHSVDSFWCEESKLVGHFDPKGVVSKLQKDCRSLLLC